MNTKRTAMDRKQVQSMVINDAIMRTKNWDTLMPDKQSSIARRALVATAIRRLKGASTIQIPEQKLFFEVICTAILDAEIQTATSQTQGARQYFNNNNHAGHAEVCGLDPDYVIDTLRTFFDWVPDTGE